MDSTRQLQRFRDITSLGYSVLRILGIACSMVRLAHTRRTAALMDVTAEGLNTNPLRKPPVVSTFVLPTMVPGAAMLGLITIADSGMSNANRNKFVAAWLQHWKDNLGNPSRMPCKVIQAYLDYMDISAEMLDDQMDWECWPLDDEVEEFDFDIPLESSPTL